MGRDVVLLRSVGWVSKPLLFGVRSSAFGRSTDTRCLGWSAACAGSLFEDFSGCRARAGAADGPLAAARSLGEGSKWFFHI